MLDQKKPYVVGLTGGIGAGKSTVVQTIRELHIPVFDSDACVHQLYLRDDNIKELTRRYGDLGERPRQTLAKLAWQDPTVRQDLESLFIPQVYAEIQAFISEHEGLVRELVIIDAPTLFEHGLDKIVDWVVVVDSPLETRWHRVRNREGMTRDKFDKVVAAQISDEERLSRCDSKICNDASLDDLIFQTRRQIIKLEKLINA